MAKDSEAQKRWDKENTVMVSIKFQRKTDTDIIEYLNEKEDPPAVTKQLLIKQGLRILMEQEGFVYTPPADNTDDEE